jgi:ATP-binding cassette subfamily F protein 3
MRLREGHGRPPSCASAISRSTRWTSCTSTKRRSSTSAALRPEETPAEAARAAGGLRADGAEQAETVVAQLSGGQKARLSLLLATLDAPHLLILDEPTNHLDIESREALVEALTAYTGAVILVSHDMHLLSLVADRLWLVKDGRVAPYEGDLESYRALLLKGEEKPPKPEKPRKKPLTHDQIKELRSEVKKCEARVAKIEEMRDKLATKLADPALYEDGRAGELGTWQKKYAEVMDGLDRAEALWMAAAEKLEAGRGADPQHLPRVQSAGRSGGRRHRCRNRPRRGSPPPRG